MKSASASRDSNLSITEWTRELLEAHSVQCHLSYDKSGKKANLWATLPTENGEAKTGSLVLSGHTGVIPVDGQLWMSMAEENNGRKSIMVYAGNTKCHETRTTPIVAPLRP